jgi:hypothetical protein
MHLIIIEYALVAFPIEGKTIYGSNEQPYIKPIKNSSPTLLIDNIISAIP